MFEMRHQVLRHAISRVNGQPMSDPVSTESDSVDEPVDHVTLRCKHHRNILTICALIVVLALTLQTRSDQRIEFAWLPGVPMPETCASRSMFDFECPGCGLTRSFIAIAAGDFSDAFRLNRTGWLLAIAMLIQFPYRLYLLRRIKTHGLPEPVPGWLKLAFSWTLIAALIGNWALKILGI